MRMTLYYITHTVKNQIRKLFRTWVAVFLLVCLLAGVIFGLGAAALASLFEENEPNGDDHYEETLPDDDAAAPDPAEIVALTELLTGGIVLIVLFFAAFSADKSGSSIFQMADVNLLFQAPLSPQAVLLFRLVMQAGTSLLATLYLLFQVPNLVLNLGLGIGAAFAILGAWFLLLIYQKLISVLLYTVCSTKENLKKRIRPALYVLLGVIGVSFILFSKPYGNDYFAAACAFFNAPVTRYIPVWGWLKAMVMCALSSNVAGLLLSVLALILLGLLLLFIIRRQKADFYEEAMARSEETAALREAQQTAGVKQRKKDRGERLKRNGFARGNGATVYFQKALYNRFRFAYLCVFTKTSITYLMVALGVSALMQFSLKISFFPAVALTLAGLSFYRALGNPIATDIAQEHFFLVPDSAHRKVFFSFAAGIVNSALDLLPAFLLSAVLLRADPLEASVWALLVLSLGAFSDAVGMFIDLSLSTGLSQMLKSLVQILFVYFGIAPTAILMVLGFALDRLLLFALLATLLNLAITALSLALSPLFIERGRK
ncbi:MAG: hypothetical protein IKC75_02250 [Clostridia bacterium]|nr:hypothetical protein [Clostridia bacterium]